jgi:hypothetical protein
MLEINNKQITYKLSWLEKVGAFGKSPTAKLSNLIKVSQSDNPWNTKVIRGVRAPGAGIPFFIMLGTLRSFRGKDFTIIYKRRPVLILDFENERFRRWVIPDSEASRELLRATGKLLTL